MTSAVQVFKDHAALPEASGLQIADAFFQYQQIMQGTSFSADQGTNISKAKKLIAAFENIQITPELTLKYNMQDLQNAQFISAANVGEYSNVLKKAIGDYQNQGLSTKDACIRGLQKQQEYISIARGANNEVNSLSQDFILEGRLKTQIFNDTYGELTSEQKDTLEATIGKDLGPNITQIDYVLAVNLDLPMYTSTRPEIIAMANEVTNQTPKATISVNENNGFLRNQFDNWKNTEGISPMDVLAVGALGAAIFYRLGKNMLHKKPNHFSKAQTSKPSEKSGFDYS